MPPRPASFFEGVTKECVYGVSTATPTEAARAATATIFIIKRCASLYRAIRDPFGAGHKSLRRAAQNVRTF